MFVLLRKFEVKLMNKLSTQSYSRRLASEYTKVKFNNGVKEITMCNQKTRHDAFLAIPCFLSRIGNALSKDMMNDILSHIKQDTDNTELRVIVISAEGPVFSAGHNLKELTEEKGSETHKEIVTLCSKLMLGILRSPVPVVAKVDGIAAAAGCQLVAQCDIAVCSEKSTFSTPGATFGIFCSTPSIPLVRTVPKMTANYMLFTGKSISSSEAYNSGLVAKVCPQEKLEEEVQDICKAISSKSRSVIELGKQFLYRQLQENITTAYELGEVTMVENLRLKDGKEGVRSFVEKRKANWLHTFEK